MTKSNDRIGFDYKIEPKKNDVLKQFKHLFKPTINKSDEKQYSYNYLYEEVNNITD
jgi:hypothetical protein